MKMFVNHQIKVARECNGLTQQELADKVGVTRQQIHLWETHDKGLTVSSLSKLADAMKCPINFFFKRDEP